LVVIAEGGEAIRAGMLNAVLETETTEAAKKPGVASWMIGIVLLALGLSLAAWGLMEREQARPDLFFGAGALILIAGLVLTSAFIRKLDSRHCPKGSRSARWASAASLAGANGAAPRLLF
jgi:hypothetical protein